MQSDSPLDAPRPDFDVGLIVAAQQGDDRAHAAIYSRYATRIFTLIYRLVPRRAQAEDLLHDTFVEVLRSIDSYSGQGSFEGWLRSIAVNKCLMQLRSPWHRSRAWIDDSLLRSSELDEAPALDKSLSDQTELAAAMSVLTPVSRAVVWLHDVEGYTHAEIAKALGRTVSFSKSQLARAHERLREILVTREETTPCAPVTHSLSISS
jgi:RNA polymerase sigma factor (sigma-70 family)